MDPISSFLVSQAVGKAFDVAIASPFQALMRKRAEVGREVLFEEVRSGRTFTSEHDLEAAAAMAIRYSRAVAEGAARRNLRLMARVIDGMAENEALYPDAFLRWADLIASMSREEIITVATLYRLHVEAAEEPRMADPATLAMERAHIALTGPNLLFANDGEFGQTLSSLTRTGLVSTGSGYGHLVYYTTPKMAQLVHLAGLETMLEPDAGR